MNEWKFERTDGMPKGEEAKRYRYFGFDADNASYVLRWTDLEGGHWVALGYDQRGEPIFYIIRAENADLIKAHALCPPRWSDLGLAPRGGELSEMSAEEIASGIHKRLIAMGVDVGDENAIMAGVAALRRKADALYEALEMLLADIEAIHASQALTPPVTSLEARNIERARAALSASKQGADTPQGTADEVSSRGEQKP